MNGSKDLADEMFPTHYDFGWKQAGMCWMLDLAICFICVQVIDQIMMHGDGGKSRGKWITFPAWLAWAIPIEVLHARRIKIAEAAATFCMVTHGGYTR
jgi:hypothetical protein